MFVDSNRKLCYFRLSPDGRRVLFGGRARLTDVDERTSALALYRRMVAVWPELLGVHLTHSWQGNVAMTFDHLPHMGDHLPHMGNRGGLHFAMGCNGSGVAMAGYLGQQTALKILGRQNRPCPFEGPFPGTPSTAATPGSCPRSAPGTACGTRWMRIPGDHEAERHQLADVGALGGRPRAEARTAAATPLGRVATHARTWRMPVAPLRPRRVHHRHGAAGGRGKDGVAVRGGKLIAAPQQLFVVLA